jgi:hemerythrin-like domain-containing protein
LVSVQAIGLMMIEHRLIEKIVPILEQELDRLNRGGDPDPILIESAVDFFRTYADRTHHGKEEDILFRELKKKQLDPDHQRIMSELENEHVIARATVGGLLESKNKWINGDKESLGRIKENLSKLVKLYPPHIQKEDKNFFLQTRKYFSDEEMLNLLLESYEFDRNMIHEKYRKMIEALS